jgi:hypothetical protein
MVAERRTIDDFTKDIDTNIRLSKTRRITNKFNKDLKNKSIWENSIKDTIGSEILDDWRNTYRVCCMTSYEEFEFQCVGELIFETLFDKVKSLDCIRLDITKISDKRARTHSCIILRI